MKKKVTIDEQAEIAKCSYEKAVETYASNPCEYSKIILLSCMDQVIEWDRLRFEFNKRGIDPARSCFDPDLDSLWRKLSCFCSNIDLI